MKEQLTSLISNHPPAAGGTGSGATFNVPFHWGNYVPVVPSRPIWQIYVICYHYRVMLLKNSKRKRLYDSHTLLLDVLICNVPG